eukprot:2969468-Prorocentrum_lima.AAC.1
MTSSLVGSEMCIRDSPLPKQQATEAALDHKRPRLDHHKGGQDADPPGTVSYTHLTLPTICSV